MKYAVLFSLKAEEDLQAMFDYLVPLAGQTIARAYVTRIYNYCLGFECFPERGVERGDIRPGLRIVGYHRRATIAFVIIDTDVIILRVFHKGENVDMSTFSFSNEDI